MQEVWKAVAGFEDYYEVSNLGRVRRIKGGSGAQSGKVLKQYLMGGGYQYVILSNNNKTKGFRVHRLVAQTFISNPDNKSEVNHINGIKTDNRVENLEWCTKSENMQHAWRTGLFEGTTGKHLTEEHKNKIGDAKKGNKNVKDRIWINNGVENRRIRPEKLQEFLNNGYVKGRKLLVG